MKDTDILKAAGNIEDEYILEADEKKTEKAAKPFAKRRWVKWTGAVAALLVVAFIGSSMSGLFSGGRKGAASYDNGQKPESTFDGSQDNYSLGSNHYGEISDFDAAPSDDKLYETNLDVSPGVLASVKLIYTADIDAQTADFDTASKGIADLVQSMGGYFERQNIDNTSRYDGAALKKGTYVIRIPAEHYAEFLSSVGENITVKSLNESVKDVGLVYADAEQHIKTLSIKLDRLQELLSRATEMSDIITIESAISDTEYELSCYQSDINWYDSLISFSTVNITLVEAARPGSGIEEKENFFSELGSSFLDGLEKTWNNISGFFYWLSYNLIGLAVLALIVVLLIKFRPFTKLYRKIRRLD